MLNLFKKKPEQQKESIPYLTDILQYKGHWARIYQDDEGMYVGEVLEPHPITTFWVSNKNEIEEAFHRAVDGMLSSEADTQ